MGEWVAARDLERNGRRLRLFCLPHAGSGAAGFQRWKRMLPGWVGVCPVMLPGREARMAEPAIDSAEEIVAGLTEAVGERLGELPYAVFGHSMGSLLGFGWAQRVERAGWPGPVRVFCSGRAGPGVRAGGVADLEDEALLAALRQRYGAEATRLMEHAEMRAMFLPVLRADLRVVEGFRAGGERLRCGISAYAGLADQSVPDLAGWAEVSGPGFRSERFPGGHFYTFAEGQTGLLARLGKELERSLLRGSGRAHG